MSISKNSALLFKTLWIPDSNKIATLRSKYSLCESALTSLKKDAPKEISQDSILVKSTTPQTPSIKETPPKPIKDTQEEKRLIAPQVINTKPDLISNWTQLEQQIIACTNCKLCSNGRTQVVIERGNREAKWMFIGEGPGEQEDLQGKPFVGASGQLLDKMITAMQLNNQNDVYIANVVKCRPPRNRNPELEEINACKNYLLSQIALVKPQIIITLGRYAAQTLLENETAIGKLRNKVHDFQGIPLIVTYHPAYLLRTPDAKKDAWEDLKLALTEYNKAL